MSAPLVSRKSTPEDYEAIAAYLIAALDLDPGDRAIDRSLCYWKYWQPHPSWAGSRSHVLMQGDRIVAHLAAWPVQLQGEFGTVASVHFLDWAGSRDIRGAGREVLKSFIPLSPVWTDFGGRARTKTILKAFGFQPVNPLRILARPLRPFRQALTHPLRNWKLPARYVRNAIWSMIPVSNVPSGWEACEVAPEEVPEHLWPRAAPGQAVSARSAEWYRYFFTCPIAKVRLYLLLQEGKPVGYFCLVFGPSQVKLVDYFLSPMTRESCAVLAAIVQDVALREETCNEIVAGVTETEIKQALSSAGFRLLREEPLKVLHIGSELRDVRHFRLTLLDGDAGYLNSGKPSYVT